MARLFLAIAFVFAFASSAFAQGCGSSNPNCIVPTALPGTSNNQAASTAFVQNAVQLPVNGVNIVVNPYTPSTGFPASGIGLGIQETVTGTCSTSNGAACHYNFIDIVSDNAVVGPNSQGNWGTGEGFLVNHNFGGAAATGNRGAGIFNLVQTATTGNTAAGVSYSALAAFATAQANDNGTGVTQPTARGQLSTVNFISHLQSSATNWIVMQGGEVDIIAESGSSVYEKVGWQITQLSTDAVQGTTWDAALGINTGGGTAPGWKVGLLFGGLQGFSPFTSSSTAILADSSVTTVGSVLDFSAATIQTNFLNSKTFSVTGAGVVTSGLNGTSGGQIRLRGSTSGGSTLSTDSTGNLILANGTANQVMLFNDGGGNGSMFQVNGASGTIAGHVTVSAATTGNAPQIGLTGSDTNISLQIVPKGTGSIIAPTIIHTAAAPTVAAGQIGYGGTTAANTNCGSTLSAPPTSCVVINVAGTTHYIPYY